MNSALILSVGLWANALIALYAGWVAPDSVSFWQIMTRLSGRVSLGVFAILMYYETFLLTRRNVPAFLQKSQLWHWSAGLAIHHYWHLCCIAIYVRSSGIELVPIRLAGGAFAYLLVGVAPFLHAKEIEKVWKRPIRFLYLYWVWFVIFMTYVARLTGQFPQAGGTFIEYVVLMSCSVLLLLGHFYLLLTRKKAAGK